MFGTQTNEMGWRLRMLLSCQQGGRMLQQIASLVIIPFLAGQACVPAPHATFLLVTSSLDPTDLALLQA